MADRAFHQSATQGVEHIDYLFTVKAATVVTNPPTFVEGDTAGASTGSYIKCSKVSTGVYRFTTMDPFLGFVNGSANMVMANPDSNTYTQCKKPVQVTNNGKAGCWQFDVYVLVNNSGTFTATDMTAGDYLCVQLRYRNSGSLP